MNLGETILLCGAIIIALSIIAVILDIHDKRKKRK